MLCAGKGESIFDSLPRVSFWVWWPEPHRGRKMAICKGHLIGSGPAGTNPPPPWWECALFVKSLFLCLEQAGRSATFGILDAKKSVQPPAKQEYKRVHGRDGGWQPNHCLAGAPPGESCSGVIPPSMPQACNSQQGLHVLRPLRFGHEVTIRSISLRVQRHQEAGFCFAPASHEDGTPRAGGVDAVTH